MRHACTRVLGLALLSSLALGAAASAFQSPGAERLNLGLRGVYFVPNEGQWSDAAVIFGYRSRGLDIAFRGSSFTMHLAREISEVSPTRERDHAAAHAAAEPSPDREGAVLDDRRSDALLSPQTEPIVDLRQPERSLEHLTLAVTFPGSNDVQPIAAQPRSARFNYYIGDAESNWASNVPTFGEVVYPNLYDGIDLHIAGAGARGFASESNPDGVLKYEFHIAPGADWSQIRIRYDGIDSLCIDETGRLHIATSFGTLTDAAPLVWQEGSTSRDSKAAVLHDQISTPLTEARGSSDLPPSLGSAGEGRRGGASPFSAPRAQTTDRPSPIPARFELVDATTYTITLDGPIDPTRELIIDPDVQWMTYLGGRTGDSAASLALDEESNLLIVGNTNSSDLIGRTNELISTECAFVSKITAHGQMQWSTYFGGYQDDTGSAIAVTGDGVIVIAGDTRSPKLPGHMNRPYGGYRDAFVAAFRPNGTLIRSRYLGGTGTDEARDLFAGPNDAIYVVGRTSSTDFVGAINQRYGGGDAFVSRLSLDGQVEWTRYLGGTSADDGTSIACDGGSNLFVAGTTDSRDFFGRTNNYPQGLHEAFVARVQFDGQLLWATYVGGDYRNSGYDVAADASANSFVVGYTNAPDLPARLNSRLGDYDGFVAKLSPGGTVLWSLYLGGSTSEFAYAVKVGRSSRIYIAGETWSSDFEFAANEIHGDKDGFITSVDQNGENRQALFLGGSDDDSIAAMALDSTDDAFLAGYTRSVDFEGRTNSYFGLGDAGVLHVNAPISIAVRTSCPLPGTIQLGWSNATPDAMIALLFARDTGSFVIPNNHSCPGTTLGLGAEQIQVAFTGNSDANGSGTLNSTIGPGVCGGYLQLLDLTTCATSNVARIE